MSARFCYFLTVFVLLHCVLGQLELRLDECEIFMNESLITFPGWPFQLDCNDYDWSFGGRQMIECYVSGENTPPSLAPVQFRLNSSSSFVLSLVFDDNSCSSRIITVHLRSLASRPTFESVNYDFTNNINVVQLERTFRDPVTFNCLPPSNEVGPMHNLALPPTYKATWWRAQRFENGTLSRHRELYLSPFRNYTQFVMNSHKARFIPYPGSPQSIQLFSSNYFDPAVYSCELQYGNESAFITHQELCIKNAITDREPQVFCTKQYSFVDGDTAEVTCFVYTSNVMIEPEELEVTWLKEETNEPRCTYLYQSGNEVTAVPRYNCSINKFQNLPQKCFTYVPSNEELDEYPDIKSFEIKFSIRNFNEEDSGGYSIQVRYKSRSSSSSPPLFVEFQPRTTQESEPYIILLAVVLGLSFVVLAAAFAASRM